MVGGRFNQLERVAFFFGAVDVRTSTNESANLITMCAQAESLKYKLLGGLAVRRACYGVLRFIMESGAKGAEVRG